MMACPRAAPALPREAGRLRPERRRRLLRRGRSRCGESDLGWRRDVDGAGAARGRVCHGVAPRRCAAQQAAACIPVRVLNLSATSRSRLRTPSFHLPPRPHPLVVGYVAVVERGAHPLARCGISGRVSVSHHTSTGGLLPPPPFLLSPFQPHVIVRSRWACNYPFGGRTNFYRPNFRSV